MTKKTLVTTLIIQTFCWFSIVWFLLGNNTVEARNLLQVATPQPFVGSIYYGQKSVWQVFDHNFPNDGQENNYVVHYDGTQHNPATNTPAAPGATPEPGEWIRGGYGYDDHVGIDYGLIYQPVLAAASGIVETAGWSNPANHRAGYGLHVVMNHPDNAGYETWYGHLSSLTVQTGDEISIENLADPADRQRVLGISGNTGNVFSSSGGCGNVENDHTCGYHLHFEVRQNNIFVNPYGWIAAPAGPDGTPTVDPWASIGAASYNLWVTPPAVTSSQYQANGSILTEPPLPAPYITVDNASEQFQDPDNHPGNCMTSEAGGYNGMFHHAQVGGTTCRVRWTISPPNGATPNDDGYYDLYAYIPETSLTLSRGAVYQIFHVPEGSSQLQEKQAIAVQAVFPNSDYENNSNWVYLGRYHFVLDGTEYVELSNTTFAGDDASFYVAADAIQLSANTLPPVNTATPSPSTTFTPSPTSTPTPSGTPTLAAPPHQPLIPTT